MSSLNSYFKALFPKYEKHDSHKDYINIGMQDSEFRIYYPIKTRDGNTSSYLIKLEHLRTLQTDDTAELTVEFEDDYQIKNVQCTYTYKDGIPQLLSWSGLAVGTGVGLAATVAGLAATGPAGIAIGIGGFVVGTAVASAFTIVGELAGKVQSSLDGGGTAYFVEVVGHAILRLQMALLSKQKGKLTSPKIACSLQTFRDALRDNSHISHVQKYDLSGTERMAKVEYEYHGNACRTWRPNQTFTEYKDNENDYVAFTMSGKIDIVRTSYGLDALGQDDHVHWMAGYNYECELICAHVTMNLSGYDTVYLPDLSINEQKEVVAIDPTATTNPNAQVSQNTSDIFEAIKGQVDRYMRSLPDYDSFPSSRTHIDGLVRDNFMCFTDSIYTPS